MTSIRHNVRRGISMIEVIASTLIVATILLVSLTASSNLMRNQTVANAGVEGQLLACHFLDEVTSLRFEDPGLNRVFGREADESAALRTTLDDVDDYHGLVLSPPTDRQGVLLSGYVGWSVAWTVSPADTTPVGFVDVVNVEAPLRQVCVVCTSPTGTVTNAKAIVSRTASTLDSSIAHQRLIKLSVTRSGAADIEVVTPLRNHPSSIDNHPLSSELQNVE
jgi:hypothetical protein